MAVYSRSLGDSGGDDRKVYLIDSPGFDDARRPEVETLKLLTTYLCTSYATGGHIHGIVMFHPITGNRMEGSDVRAIELLKAICGFGSYRNVVISTTMWPDVETRSQAERTDYVNRESQLTGDHRFFGDLVERGARMFRYDKHGYRGTGQEGKWATAEGIVDYLINESDSDNDQELRRGEPDPLVLQLQREIIDEGKVLSATAAGGVVTEYLASKERKLQRVEAQIDAMRQRDEAPGVGGNVNLMNLRAEIQRNRESLAEQIKDLEKRVAEHCLATFQAMLRNLDLEELSRRIEIVPEHNDDKGDDGEEGKENRTDPAASGTTEPNITNQERENGAAKKGGKPARRAGTNLVPSTGELEAQIGRPTNTTGTKKPRKVTLITPAIPPQQLAPRARKARPHLVRLRAQRGETIADNIVNGMMNGVSAGFISAIMAGGCLLTAPLEYRTVCLFSSFDMG